MDDSLSYESLLKLFDGVKRHGCISWALGEGAELGNRVIHEAVVRCVRERTVASSLFYTGTVEETCSTRSHDVGGGSRVINQTSGWKMPLLLRCFSKSFGSTVKTLMVRLVQRFGTSL